MVFISGDNSALNAALSPAGAVIRELARVPLTDEAGTFRIRGTYKIQTPTDAEFTISVQDAAEDPDTLGLVITLPLDGASLGTPAVDNGTGVTISGTPFYFQSGSGTLQSFNVVCAIPAPIGEGNVWEVIIDPQVGAGKAAPVVFTHLEIERTA